MSKPKNLAVEAVEKFHNDVVTGKCNKFMIVALVDVGNGMFNLATMDSENLGLIEFLGMSSFLQSVSYYRATTSLRDQEKVKKEGLSIAKEPTEEV